MTASTTTAQLAGVRVLCADDDDCWRDLMCGILRRAGAGVIASMHGFEALCALRRSEYDVLVSDLHMPCMNGLELIREAKRSYIAPRVALAISGETRWFAEAARAGFERVLLKPVSFRDVLTTVVELLAQAPRRAFHAAM